MEASCNTLAHSQGQYLSSLFKQRLNKRYLSLQPAKQEITNRMSLDMTEEAIFVYIIYIIKCYSISEFSSFIYCSLVIPKKL
jgi:hypothetical protein